MTETANPTWFQTVIKQIQTHHPTVFYLALKYTILFNMITSVVGGLLWVTLWSVANDVKSASDFYVKFQPLNEALPGWIPVAISYIFTISIIVNSALLILLITGRIIDSNNKKEEGDQAN